MNKFLTLEEEQEIALKSAEFIIANKAKPKFEEIRDSNNKLIQVTEISDDGRIVITKTNLKGLE